MGKLNSRQNKILEILNDYEWIKSNDLADALIVSTRTIRSDIKKINNIKNNIIESNNSYGYRLKPQIEESKVEYKLIDIIPETPKDRYIYILISLLKNSSGIYITELCDKLYISLATFDQDIKVVKNKLLDYHKIAIKRHNDKLFLEGNEQEKRLLYRDLILYLNNNNFLNINELNNYFPSINLVEIKQIIKEVFAKHQYDVKDKFALLLIIYLSISIDRISQEACIIDNFSSNNEEYKIAEEIFEQIIIRNNIDIPNNEINYLAYLIESIKLDNNVDEFTNSNIINDIIELINEKFQIDLSDDELFKDALKKHIKSLIQRKSDNLVLDNLYLLEIKDKYPLEFEIAIYIADMLNKKYCFDINESEIGFISIHIGAAIERKKEIHKYKVILIYPMDAQLAKQYTNKLEEIFADRINILECLNIFEEDKIKMLNPDLILTTFDIKHSLDIETINISLFFNKEDALKINNSLEKLDKNDFLINYRSKLIDKINYDCYFENLNVSNKEEAIKTICDYMIDKKILNHDYYDLILERDNLSSTSNELKMAIPRIICKNDQSVISIAHLNKPIQWGNNQVKLIILIFISEKDILLFNQLFKIMVNIKENKLKILSLIKTQKYEEFINKLQG